MADAAGGKKQNGPQIGWRDVRNEVQLSAPLLVLCSLCLCLCLMLELHVHTIMVSVGWYLDRCWALELRWWCWELAVHLLGRVWLQNKLGLTALHCSTYLELGGVQCRSVHQCRPGPTLPWDRYVPLCTCILRVKVAALHGVERPSPIYAGRGCLGSRS